VTNTYVLSCLFGPRLLRSWLLVALSSLCLCAAAVAAETLTASPNGQPATLAQALERAQDGDTIELLPGRYTEIGLVIENRRLTLRGLPGGPDRRLPVFDGEGRVGPARALLTVRGGEVTIDSLEFRGARSTQSDGAGVRLEGGRLKLLRSRFQDNEHGLVTSNDESAEVFIDSTEFGMAPRVVGGLYHLVNIGRIARFEAVGSRFQQGFEGHLIKTRARQTVLRYNIIHDGPRGGASYAVDLPAGGDALLIGNVIAQGRESQNIGLIAFGADDSAWPRSRLVLAHNTLLNYRLLPGWFLRVFSDRLPADTEVLAVNNLTAGGGLFEWGAPGRFEGNAAVSFGALLDIDTYAFELPPGSSRRGSGVDPRRLGGLDLSPQAEFKWPTGIQPLGPQTRWTPGAYQR